MSESFLLRKIILPSGRAIEVVYLGDQAIDRVHPTPMADYVEEFVDALRLDLIRPDDFKEA